MIAGRDAARTTPAPALRRSASPIHVRYLVPGLFPRHVPWRRQILGPERARPARIPSLRDAVVACQEAGTAPAGDPSALVLVAWSAVHGFATLWVDRALPFEGMRPEQMAPELGRLLARMFAALARVPA